MGSPTTISPETQLILDMLRKTQQELSELREYVQQLTEREYLTVPEFSKKTGISESQVRYYCEAGQLQATQPNGDGGRWKIKATELDRFSRNSRENNHSPLRTRKKAKTTSA